MPPLSRHIFRSRHATELSKPGPDSQTDVVFEEALCSARLALRRTTVPGGLSAHKSGGGTHASVPIKKHTMAAKRPA